MDDQEIANLKKTPPEAKGRSRNSFDSSCSIGKDSNIDRILDEENMTVYALIEVSKSSETPVIREKIPLNNRDVYHMVEKLMNSEKEKLNRKILRPSLKRKYALKFSDSKGKTAEEEKLQLGDDVPGENSIPSDMTNEALSGQKSLEQRTSKGKKFFFCTMDKGDNEYDKKLSECSDLKVLYSRNSIAESDKSKLKMEKAVSTTRGTNTDIVQTPKLLDEVLRGLNLAFDIGYVGVESDRKNASDSKKTEKSSNSSATFDIGGSDGSICGNHQNFLLVPFFVTGKLTDVRKPAFTEMDTCQSQRYPPVIEYKCCCHRPVAFGNVKSYRSAADMRTGINPINIHLNTLQDIKIDYMIKNGLMYGSEKERLRNEMEENKLPAMTRAECFLEEVKTLQTKLNAIIKGLETNNLMSCQHNCNISKCSKEENIFFDNYYAKTIDEYKNSFESLMRGSNWQTIRKFDSIPSLNYNQSLRQRDAAQSNSENPQDFCVQVMMCKSASAVSERTISIPSHKSGVLALAAPKKLDKPSQFPSEAGIIANLVGNSRLKLVTSKSSPLFSTRVPCRCIKARNSSSMKFDATYIESLKLRADKLKILSADLGVVDNFSGRSRPAGLADIPTDGMQKIDSATVQEPYKRGSVVILSTNGREDENKEGLAGNQPDGRITRIKIIGNSMACNKNHRDTGMGKIKVEVEDSKNIRISNKFMKKLKTGVTPTVDNKINDNNNNNNNSNVNEWKEGENKKCIAGNTKPETPTKNNRKELSYCGGAKRQEAQLQKHAKGTENVRTGNAPTDHTPHGQKNSKLARPITQARAMSKGKERGQETGRKSISTLISKPPVSKTHQTTYKTPTERVKSVEKIEHISNKCTDTDPFLNIHPLQGISSNVKSYDHSTKTGVQASILCEHYRDSSSAPLENNNGESQAVKSIWALTKVILYKDGTQSFEVLEASSTPPGYHLSKQKSCILTAVDNNTQCNAEEKNIRH